MIQKTKLKDWAREMKEQFPSIISSGRTANIEWLTRTGERRIESVSLDCWVDEDFRDGYIAYRADEGLAPM
jgi:hypothetical protein